MARRLTREITYVQLPENRIREINDLVAAWPQETKAFMRARLNQYRPPRGMLNSFLEFLLSLFMDTPERRFHVLKDPDILTDWQKRFEISGQTNPQEAWNKILEKEVSAKDYRYLLALLEKALVVTVPGGEFGMEGHLRLSYCGSIKEIMEGVARIKWALDPESPNEIYIGDRKMRRDWK